MLMPYFKLFSNVQSLFYLLKCELSLLSEILLFFQYIKYACVKNHGLLHVLETPEK